MMRRVLVGDVVAETKQWEYEGITYHAVKIGGYWYRMARKVTPPMVKVGLVGEWLKSGRWACACERRHRRYIASCSCGRARPPRQTSFV